MFISGHPLDHYRFEIQYYGIMPVAEYNDFQAVGRTSAPSAPDHQAGLPGNQRHNTGFPGRAKNIGVLDLEDFTGKM